MREKRLYQILILSLTILLSACSTTSRIPNDELLYTGVKRFDVTPIKDEKIPGDVQSQVENAVNVAPNNSLISPYMRYPFPVGLWVYNHWDANSKGLKHWLYDKLVETPVLVSDVRPEVRVKMIEQILENNGYFSSSSSYELLQGKNKKKAKIKYTVTPKNATNKKVSFKSSNKNVAKVNAKGVVTGVKKGNAVITIKAKDGSGKSAKCKIKVVK